VIETTYTRLRAELASLLDRVTNDREVVVVRRRRAPDVAIVPADELAGLVETAHLLRSPKNARRLLKAMKRAERGAGHAASVDTLREEAGLAGEDGN
jgi:antitoxin YefM